MFKRLPLLVLAQLLALTGWAGEPPFLMAVEDVFTISGRGTVVTGRVERGSIQVGQPLELVGLEKDAQTQVVHIEVFRKLLTRVETGQNCGLLLRGLQRDQILRGQVLATPGSIQAHTTFSANTNWLPKDKGGRTTPITAEYRPYCQFRTASVTGEILDLTGSLEPSGDTPLKIRLQQPVALEKGQTFTISMGSRTIANGTITEL
ncbi:hypothetical protein ABS71_22035 [bacterium SCN 62-11]|nr:hypothetical protein [Candidatus Eremiobacteraeota bacterium]ODT56292.1 MAG: hypothetical protein ABS71_22035 [bacterium SCN 62-11]